MIIIMADFSSYELCQPFKKHIYHINLIPFYPPIYNQGMWGKNELDNFPKVK